MVPCGYVWSIARRCDSSSQLSEQWNTHGNLGGKVSVASLAYNIDQMAYALKTTDAKFLMTTPTSIDVDAGAAKQVGLSKANLFLLERKLSGYSTVHDLITIGKGYGEHGQVPAFKIPPGRTNKDICGFLSFSSGTTGLPKAVSPLNQFSRPFRFVLRNATPGYDIPPKRNCPMPSNTTMYTTKHNTCASCTPTISHNRSRPPTSPTYPP